MRLQVKGKNVEISPSIREYAERKLSKLDEAAGRPDAGRGRALRAEEPVDRRRATSPRRRSSPRGTTLRAREASPDMKASIDQLVEKLERQVKRYRERRIVEPRRHAPHHGETSNGSTPPAVRPTTTTTSRCRSSAVAVRAASPGERAPHARPLRRAAGLGRRAAWRARHPRHRARAALGRRRHRLGARARGRHGRVRGARGRHAAHRRRTCRRGRRAARRRRSRRRSTHRSARRPRRQDGRDLGRRGLVDRRPRGGAASRAASSSSS